MKISIASGKGGTGKTTVAVNLALVASAAGLNTAYLDCDVEEPNGAIFLKPEFTSDESVGVPTPEVNLDACTGCGLCGRICQFSAILAMNGRVLTFDELCHGCGGCMRVCPVGAITERQRETGRLQRGPARPLWTSDAAELHCLQGVLNIGQAMSPPLIRAVKAAAGPAEITILDCPPGTACPAVESMRGSDLAVLVTEPTPFGLHDLKLAVATVGKLGLPCGVVINRCDSGDDATRRYCLAEDIEILSEIPEIPEVARAYSRGEAASNHSASYRRGFEHLLGRLLAKGRTGVRP